MAIGQDDPGDAAAGAAGLGPSRRIGFAIDGKE